MQKFNHVCLSVSVIFCMFFVGGQQREKIHLEPWVPFSRTPTPPLHPLFWANWISGRVSTVFIKLMLCCLHTAHAAIKQTPFWVLSLHTQTHTHFSVALIQRVSHATFVSSSHLLLSLSVSRALSSSNQRATSTLPSTTSRCYTMASLPAPSPSPTTPRRRMPSFAWSHRPGKTPPSSSTRHMHLCCRSVWASSLPDLWITATSPD